MRGIKKKKKGDPAILQVSVQIPLPSKTFPNLCLPPPLPLLELLSIQLHRLSVALYWYLLQHIQLSSHIINVCALVFSPLSFPYMPKLFVIINTCKINGSPEQWLSKIVVYSAQVRNILHCDPGHIYCIEIEIQMKQVLHKNICLNKVRYTLTFLILFYFTLSHSF